MLRNDWEAKRTVITHTTPVQTTHFWMQQTIAFNNAADIENKPTNNYFHYFFIDVKHQPYSLSKIKEALTRKAAVP